MRPRHTRAHAPLQMLRVYAPHRTSSGLSPHLKKHAHIEKDGSFGLPSAAALAETRVVVSTTRSASMLAGENSPNQ